MAFEDSLAVVVGKGIGFVLMMGLIYWLSKLVEKAIDKFRSKKDDQKGRIN
jgi:hypothetical protein